MAPRGSKIRNVEAEPIRLQDAQNSPTRRSANDNYSYFNPVRQVTVDRRAANDNVEYPPQERGLPSEKGMRTKKYKSTPVRNVLVTNRKNTEKNQSPNTNGVTRKTARRALRNRKKLAKKKLLKKSVKVFKAARGTTLGTIYLNFYVWVQIPIALFSLVLFAVAAWWEQLKAESILIAGLDKAISLAGETIGELTGIPAEVLTEPIALAIAVQMLLFFLGGGLLLIFILLYVMTGSNPVLGNGVTMKFPAFIFSWICFIFPIANLLPLPLFWIASVSLSQFKE